VFNDAQRQLLKEKIPALPQVTLERTLRHDIDELVAATLPPMKLAVVDDPHTKEVLGQHVFKALKGRFACTHVTLPGVLAADEQAAQYLRMQTLSCDALVAVGSGTINDLCKYVSHLEGKPYVVFPTAASMNGYLSANASITKAGYKKTLPAHMPAAVFCDLSVIAAAPARLSKSGLGDSLARSTAQADWLLSHLLLGTAYDATPFTLLQPLEPELLEHARGIALADPKSIELLLRTLLLSGLGMTVAGGSYPASQGEHMIAHAYEMLKHKRSERVNFHGEEIGVTTLVMAQLQEQLLRGQPRFKANDFDEGKIGRLFGETAMEEAKKSFAAKQQQMRNGMGDWESAVSQIERIRIPSAQLQLILEAVEAPVSPGALDWHPDDYGAALDCARYLRERFTFLDLST
jgi:glycerol-1-phosphate dehydrogenase [NAD(P)+]